MKFQFGFSISYFSTDFHLLTIIIISQLPPFCFQFSTDFSDFTAFFDSFYHSSLPSLAAILEISVKCAPDSPPVKPDRRFRKLNQILDWSLFIKGAASGLSSSQAQAVFRNVTNKIQPLHGILVTYCPSKESFGQVL